MPVGTQGSVKTLVPRRGRGDRRAHRPRQHVPPVAAARRRRDRARSAACTRFTRWPHAMLTDSGGFQAFSLATERPQSLVGAGEDGFALPVAPRRLDARPHARGGGARAGPHRRRHPDAARRVPAGRVAARRRRGGGRADDALGTRALASPRPPRPGPLRHRAGGVLRRSARAPTPRSSGALPFDGLALGGFSVGEPIERMHETLIEVAPALDPERPRYLMGVGTPRDLVRRDRRRRRHVRLRAARPATRATARR